VGFLDVCSELKMEVLALLFHPLRGGHGLRWATEPITVDRIVVALGISHKSTVFLLTVMPM